MTDFSLHPIRLVSQIVEEVGANGICISYYKVGRPGAPRDQWPGSGEYENTSYDVVHHKKEHTLDKGPERAMAVFSKYLANRAKDTKVFRDDVQRARRCIGWEFGFQSLFGCEGDENVGNYLPTIDFKTKDAAEAWASSIELAPGSDLPALYRTGRSFHAYYQTPMQLAQWQRFMVSLLASPSVDHDWVRLKLRQRSPVVRWSANTTKHPTMPRLVRDDFGVVR